ncbi:MAG: S8 family serine peptidase [Phycisphaerae bacterium]
MYDNRRAVADRLLLAALLSGASFFPSTAQATDLDAIGVAQLRAARPELTGAGVSVGQAEASTYYNPNDPNGTAPYDPQYDQNNYEYDPAVNSTVTPTYVGKVGASPTTTYTSGLNSSHATQVASNYFATYLGAAPGVSADVEYNANYWFNNVVVANAPLQTPLAPAGAPPVSVMNQSFVFGNTSASAAAQTIQFYDNYVANHGLILVTAAGNSGAPQLPGTAYNVITVGDSNGITSVGPTSDGRSKPDISAPGGATSFSTPYVSGVAAVMVQAGQAGAGGTSASTEALAVNPRTIKALLLAGASKPVGWTHTTTAPLDPTYGAGVVNAYASYQTLAGGKRGPTTVNTSTTPATGATVGSAGWDLASLSSQVGQPVSVSHYLLNITSPSTLSTALTWYRPAGSVLNGITTITGINNFDLLLYNSAGTLVASSASTVDNVEYLYAQNLPAGAYDLQVVKQTANKVSTSDTYGLAFNAMMLGDANLDGHVDLSDLSTVLNHVGAQTSLWTDGNFDGAASVDLSDLSDVVNNFGRVSGNVAMTSPATTAAATLFASPSAAAPEPASLAILAGAIPLLARRRRS